MRNILRQLKRVKQAPQVALFNAEMSAKWWPSSSSHSIILPRDLRGPKKTSKWTENAKQLYGVWAPHMNERINARFPQNPRLSSFIENSKTPFCAQGKNHQYRAIIIFPLPRRSYKNEFFSYFTLKKNYFPCSPRWRSQERQIIIFPPARLLN